MIDTIQEKKAIRKAAAIVYMTTMLAQCVLWVVLSIMVITKSEEFYPQTIVGILMIGDAIAFGVFAFLYKKDNTLIKILILGFLFVNLVLTFTDQMGALDFVVAALNIICIGSYIVLIRKRKSLFANQLLSTS